MIVLKKYLIIFSMLLICSLTSCSETPTASQTNKVSDKTIISSSNFSSNSSIKNIEKSTTDPCLEMDSFFVVSKIEDYLLNNDFSSTSVGKAVPMGLSGMSQKIVGEKIKKGKDLYKKSISCGVIDMATECYISPENSIYLINADKINSPEDVTWGSDVTVMDEEKYISLYGNYPDKFAYTITSETILDSSIKKEESGYSLELNLDPDLGTTNYRHEIKTNGKRSEEPKFKTANVKLFYDDNFRLLKLETKDVYSVKYAILSVEVTTTIVETFNYDNIVFSQKNDFINKEN